LLRQCGGAAVRQHRPTKLGHYRSTVVFYQGARHLCRFTARDVFRGSSGL